MAIGQVHDFTHEAAGFVVLLEETDFVRQFGLDGLGDETEEDVGDGGAVGVAVEIACFVLHGEVSAGIEGEINEWEKRFGEGFEAGVVGPLAAKHAGGDREDRAVRGEAEEGEDVVDEEPVQASVAIGERVEEDERPGDGGGSEDGVDLGAEDAAGGFKERFHKRTEVFGPWGNKVDLLVASGKVVPT